jgi:hypothetical protein
MPAETTVSAGAIRRLAIDAQGYAGRYRRARAVDVETAVERSHRRTRSAQVGDY